MEKLTGTLIAYNFCVGTRVPWLPQAGSPPNQISLGDAPPLIRQPVQRGQRSTAKSDRPSNNIKKVDPPTFGTVYS